MTLRDIIYMCQDEIKIFSDDSVFEEEHFEFLINKYRAFLLKQRYSDIKKQVPDSNYQVLCLDLVETPGIDGSSCDDGQYLKSTVKVPFPASFGNTRLTTLDFFNGEISYVNRDRFKYVGKYNRFTRNLVYATQGIDGYLYLKSSNPQMYYLEKIKFTGVFMDPEEAFGLECNNSSDSSSEKNTLCEFIDKEYPIEDALVPPLIQLVVQELLGAIYRPRDGKNNSKDDLSELSLMPSKSSRRTLDE